MYGLVTEPFQLSADACTTHYGCSSDPTNTTVITNTTCTPKTSAERFADAIYFATVTLTTVGYGDLVPQGDGIRLFTVFYALLAVGIIGPAVGVLLDTCVHGVCRRRCCCVCGIGSGDLLSCNFAK